MITMHQKMKQRLTARYNLNAKAKVGDTCKCPCCGTEFVKTHYAQKFCRSKQGTVCKDYYWNFVTETKHNNTTRISPANARYHAEHIEPFIINEDYDDDQGWDAHKDSF